MQDLTTEFSRLAESKYARDSAESHALVNKIGVAFHGSVDWDLDAGEDWASILLDGRGPQAYVYAQAPLVLCVDAALARGVTPAGVTVVEVEDFDAPVLTAGSKSIEDLFGPEIAEGAFDATHFSASDLWFWTI